MMTMARLNAMTRSRPQLLSSRRSGCVASGATEVLISGFGSMSLLWELLFYTTLPDGAPLPPSVVGEFPDTPLIGSCRDKDAINLFGGASACSVFAELMKKHAALARFLRCRLVLPFVIVRTL